MRQPRLRKTPYWAQGCIGSINAAWSSISQAAVLL